MTLETIAKNDGKQTPQVIPFSLGTITISACYGWDGHAWDITYKGVTKRLHLADVLSFPGFTIKVLSDGGWCTSVSPATFQIVTSVTELPVPIGGTKMWTIKGEKGMTGTVEFPAGGLLWHITSPVVKDIYYGITGDIPGTYIDSSGRDQMVAIRNSIKIAFLDENYSGAIGEKELPFSKVKITNIGDNITRRVSIKTGDMGKWLLLIGIAAAAIYLIGGKKK